MALRFKSLRCTGKGSQSHVKGLVKTHQAGLERNTYGTFRGIRRAGKDVELGTIKPFKAKLVLK